MSKRTDELSAQNFMEYFWRLSKSVTKKEITPTTVNAACKAGANIVKMAFLVHRSEYNSPKIKRALLGK